MKRIVALTAVVILANASASPARDWAFWRGPEQTGVSREKDLPSDWSPKPGAPDNNLIWKADVPGRTTPIVQNGRIYLINAVGEGIELQERVMCLDEATGKVLWEHKFNVFLTDIVEDRLGWTNVAADPETETVFAHGTQGLLFCFDKDGKVLWKHSLTEEYGRITGYGGRVTSPVVAGDYLIIGMMCSAWGYNGKGMCRFAAFDKRTGEHIWWGTTGLPPKNTFYSVPVTTMVDGEWVLISGGGDGGVHAFSVQTGERLWKYMIGTGAINCSPVVDGNFCYIGHGDPNEGGTRQGRVACIDLTKVKDGKPEIVWKVDGIKAAYTSPVIYEGKLYITNDLGLLYILDAKTGKRVGGFRYGRNSRGSPVIADGKLFVPDVDSHFLIYELGGARPKQLSKVFFPPVAGVPTELNGSPAIVNNRIYLMTSEATYCIGKKGADAKPDPIPNPLKVVTKAPKGAKAAHLQIVPDDVLLYPGDSVDLKARTFDEKGRLIGEVDVKWALAGLRRPEGLPPAPPGGAKPPALKGELSAAAGKATKLSIATASPSQFGRVTATSEDLEASCRVRVVKELPQKISFEKVPVGRTPAGWVNTGARFAVEEMPDKSKVLKKLANTASPPLAKAHAFIGTPEMKDYSIEATVMGKQVGTDLPDAGVSASRYILNLEGNDQRVRILSWDAQPRLAVAVPFPWKKETWYRLKLTTEMMDGKMHVRGKVWEANKAEPEKWTITAVDPAPNTNGAPTVYGYATGVLPGAVGAEAFYKDIVITPNK